MIGPSLFPKDGEKADPALAGRVTAAEADITALKNGKATTGSVTAVSNRVKAVEDVAVIGHVSDRVYLGTHAITAGITFNRSALLAEPFLVGKDLKRIRFDLQLVAGGASGGTRGDTGSNLNGSSVAIGGRQGGVRLHKGLIETDLQDGLTIAVGAGGTSSTSASATGYGTAGGNTRFGWLTALGGRTYSTLAPEATDVVGANDVVLGRPGGIAVSDVPSVSISAASTAGARPSLGPGAGAGASNFAHGLGGASNEYDTILSTPRTSTGLGGAGSSAPAASFRYGAGGNGSRPLSGANSPGGAGGFPGGGGGGVLYDTAIGSNPGSGAGAAGVIRIHCYELAELR